MIKPISYLQTDIRWKNHNYSAKGENKNIGSSGCGITAAAMVIATLKDKAVTPVTTAEWSMENGYKALNQGTYYTYFVPQMKKYGINCKRLNISNLYGISNSNVHDEAINELKKGNWIIACMGKGIWTSSGHYILVYGYDNGTIYINDPASTASTRIKNTWTNFAKQVKYMWSITVPSDVISPVVNEEKYSKKQFIKDVQTAIGVKSDGIVGEKTLAALVVLSKTQNKNHKAVKSLQKYLNSIGYNCGTPDSSFGTKTYQAVLKWQKDNKLSPDGIVGINSWKKLFG